MRITASLPLGILTYLLVTLALFGGPFQAPFLLFVKSDHFGMPGWRLAIIAMMVGIWWVIYGPTNRYVRRPFRLPVFIAAAILVPTMSLVLIADWVRDLAITSFGADHVIQNSLLTSLSRAPEEFQFYLHAAALKDCKPYAWSYGAMALYPLHRNVAPNVIPGPWSAMCGITIDR